MRAIDTRLRRLEDRFTPKPDPEQGRIASLLQERRRRRCESEGNSYMPPPPLPVGVPTLTIAETLRYARNRLNRELI